MTIKRVAIVLIIYALGMAGGLELGAHFAAKNLAAIQASDVRAISDVKTNCDSRLGVQQNEIIAEQQLIARERHKAAVWKAALESVNSWELQNYLQQQQANPAPTPQPCPAPGQLEAKCGVFTVQIR